MDRQEYQEHLRYESLDAYEKAIEFFSYILENEGQERFEGAIRHAWDEPDEHFGGCLFDFTGFQNRDNGPNDDGVFLNATLFIDKKVNDSIVTTECGCLTQVKWNNPNPFGGSKGLLAEIKADPLIPNDHRKIKTIEQLERFAMYQRRLDMELRRPEPIWYQDEMDCEGNLLDEQSYYSRIGSRNEEY